MHLNSLWDEAPSNRWWWTLLSGLSCLVRRVLQVHTTHPTLTLWRSEAPRLTCLTRSRGSKFHQTFHVSSEWCHTHILVYEPCNPRGSDLPTQASLLPSDSWRGSSPSDRVEQCLDLPLTRRRLTTVLWYRVKGMSWLYHVVLASAKHQHGDWTQTPRRHQLPTNTDWSTACYQLSNGAVEIAFHE